MRRGGGSVKVTRNYQVTIPSEIRKLLGIEEGDLIRFVVEGEKVYIVPVKKKRLTYRAGFRITVEEMEEAVEEMMDASTR